MRPFLWPLFSAYALLVAPLSLFGACGLADGIRTKLSSARTSLAAPVGLAAPADEQAASAVLDHPAVTGLWDIKFYAEGQLVDEGFDAWHADGIETLNDNPPPATGNVCLGVFAQTGQRTFKLKHPSWVYDETNTNVIGIATIRETITMDRSGNGFSGTFTVDVVDTSGNPVGHTEGTVKATRIKAED